MYMYVADTHVAEQLWYVLVRLSIMWFICRMPQHSNGLGVNLVGLFSGNFKEHAPAFLAQTTLQIHQG